MIAVIFEVFPADGRKDDYLAHAAKLRGDPLRLYFAAPNCSRSRPRQRKQRDSPRRRREMCGADRERFPGSAGCGRRSASKD